MRSRGSQKPFLQCSSCPSKKGHASPMGTSPLAACAAAPAAPRSATRHPAAPPSHNATRTLRVLHQFPRKQKKEATEGPEQGPGEPGEPGSPGAGSLPWQCPHPAARAAAFSGREQGLLNHCELQRAVGRFAHLHARGMSNGSRHEGGINEPDYTHTCNWRLCPCTICLHRLLWKPSPQPLLPACTRELHQGQVTDRDLFLLVWSLHHSQTSEIHSHVRSKLGRHLLNDLTLGKRIFPQSQIPRACFKRRRYGVSPAFWIGL